MTTVICPKCGTENPGDAENCRNCRIILKMVLEHAEGQEPIQAVKSLEKTEMEGMTQKIEPGKLIVKSTGTGCLTGLILSLILVVIGFIFIFPNLGFGGEGVLIIGSLIIIMNMIICPLQGLLISWLVTRFGSHSRSQALVIGALVPMIMMVVSLMVLGPMGEDPNIIILIMLYVAIGVWIADRIFRRMLVDSSIVETRTRGFYISVAVLAIVTIYIGVYLFLPGLLSFPFYGTSYETHTMQFALGTRYYVGCSDSSIELEFVESTDRTVSVCSNSLHNFLENKTDTTVQVEFKATKKITERNWTYEILSVDSWSGTLKIYSVGYSGLYPDIPLQHKINLLP